MTKADLLDIMEFNRGKTIGLLDAIAKVPDADLVLAFRPGPDRAHIAWQLMHIAATDDRHVFTRAQKIDPKQPDHVKRFAGGSTPDDEIPSLDQIRTYLTQARDHLKSYVATIPDSAMGTKPNEQFPWTYTEWLKVLAWHEAHHQGQAHLSFNIYRAVNDPTITKVGH